MSERGPFGREVREQLGEPSALWLRRQRQELRRAFAVSLRPTSRAPRWAFAAALLVVATVGGVFWLAAPRWRPLARATDEMVLNAPGSERRVELADGSSLVLARLSLARVNRATDTTSCVVEVGSVRFDVAPQKGRQFTVVAGAFKIRVVGTRFSVSRDSAGVVEVRVEHGIVRVDAPSRSAPFELEAGDRLRGDDGGVVLTHPAPAPAPASPAVAAAEPATPLPTPQPLASIAPKATAVDAAGDWRKLYREGNYAAALASARQVGVERLLDSLGAQPLADLADAARLAGDSELALRALGCVERRFPGTTQAQDAIFLSGRMHAARRQADSALARFERYLAQNPHGTYSLEATGRLVELYSARGDARAKATAESYLERAPHGPYQRLCRSVLAAP